MDIKFRPHHFLCSLCFKGMGYSTAFISNYIKIMDELNSPEGDETNIEIVKHTDSICDPCPNRQELSCSTEDKITALDHAHAQALNIKAGDIISWGEAKKRIANNISIDKHHEICAACEWKKYGICENMLKEFLGTHNGSEQL